MNWSSKWDSGPLPNDGSVGWEDIFKSASEMLASANPLLNPSGVVEYGTDELATLSWYHGNKLYHAQVTIIGDLALEHDDDGWNIFHVPTLTLFSKAVPSYTTGWTDNEFSDGQISFEYDKQPLLNWMKKVQESYPTAWTMLRCLTPETYEDSGQSAKDIILKWCLSVKVE